jgi:hypothetical protein
VKIGRARQAADMGREDAVFAAASHGGFLPIISADESYAVRPDAHKVASRASGRRAIAHWAT